MGLEVEKMISEKELEKIFAGEIKKAGGRAYKFTSPGNDGVPDRIVCMPEGRVIFVELKTDKGETSKLQKMQIAKLESLGQQVTVLYGLTGLAQFFMFYGFDEAAKRIAKRIERERRKQA